MDTHTTTETRRIMRERSTGMKVHQAAARRATRGHVRSSRTTTYRVDTGVRGASTRTVRPEQIDVIEQTLEATARNARGVVISWAVVSERVLGPVVGDGGTASRS